jgi:hypothetical protein
MTSPVSNDRRTINNVFGTELPQESTDERDPDAVRYADDREQWLRENVPPHHT